MAWPPQFLDELIDRTDLVDLVGESVRLTKKGNSYWGCCPFHSEKTPSFHVVPDRQMYKCFGCGKCEKACRSGALKLEDLPDGQTRVVVTPWKCSECGVCVAACSNSGIDGMKLRQLTTLGPVSVYKCSKTLCADCGKPIAPNSSEGICSVCRIKRRTKQRQEEAAARAKERIAEREARKAAEEAAKAAAAELAAENAANASGAAAAETAAVPVSAAPAAAAATAVSVAETASAPEKD